MSERSIAQGGWTRQTAAGLGWAIVALVLSAWIALFVWAALDTCSYDCADLRRGRAAVFLWVLSLPGLPIGGALIAFSGGLTGSNRIVRSGVELIFGVAAVGSLLIAGYGGAHAIGTLVRRATLTCAPDSGPALCFQWTSTVALGVVACGWFGTIGGISWLVANKASQNETKAPRGPSLLTVVPAFLLPPLFLFIAIETAIDRPNFYIGGLVPDAGTHDFPYGTEPSQLLEQDEPEPVFVKFLPARQAGHQTGYELSNLKVNVQDHPSLGYRYRVRYDGKWVAEGRPRPQQCTYTFFGKPRRVVFTHDSGFAFGKPWDARAFTGWGIVFFEDEDWIGEPRWARVNCKNDGPPRYPGLSRSSD